MRGQVGFAVIIGLIVIMAVVVTWAYLQMVGPPVGVPAEVAAEQRLVEDYVVGLVRAGADKTVYKIENTGGYLTADLAGGLEAGIEVPPMIVYGGFGVAYWQQCDNLLYPTDSDIKRHIEIGIENYLRDNLDQEMVVEGKPVKFNLDRLSVSVAVQDDRIEPIVVNLPTQVANFSIQKPYAASYPTKLGRIVKFAADFSKELKASRALEGFTVGELMSTDTLPTRGYLDRCGEILFLKPDEIETGLKKVAVNTLRGLVWWQDTPPSTRSNLIPTVNGNRYPGLGIKPWIPPDFTFDVTQPVLIVNDKPVVYTAASGLPNFAFPGCFKWFNVDYSVTYPVVFAVDDPLTGQKFRFAVLVDVEDMEPGECGVAVPVCEELDCSARLVVEGPDGPIGSASAMFGGCHIGTSRADGVIEGPVLCGRHELEIAASGYSPWIENRSDFELDGDYTLAKLLEVGVKFYQLRKDCSSSPVDNESVSAVFSNGYFAMAGNEDPEAGYGECIEGDKAIHDECYGCFEEKEATECMALDVCVQSFRLRAECVKDTLTASGQTTVAAGQQSLSLLVTNPIKEAQYINTDYSFAIISLSLDPVEVNIPAEAEEIKIYVPDSDEVVESGIERWDSWFDQCNEQCWWDLDCDPMPSAGGCAVKNTLEKKWEHCRESCAKEIATVKGLEKVKDYNFTDVLEDCKEYGIEVLEVLA